MRGFLTLALFLFKRALQDISGERIIEAATVCATPCIRAALWMKYCSTVEWESGKRYSSAIVCLAVLSFGVPHISFFHSHPLPSLALSPSSSSNLSPPGLVASLCVLSFFSSSCVSTGRNLSLVGVLTLDCRGVNIRGTEVVTRTNISVCRS